MTTIAVDPDHHREKIGTRLMYELIQAAVDMGAVAVSLEVRVTNWGAQRLYGRFGFRPVGIRKNYYQETGEDALIMWIDDIRDADYRTRLRRPHRRAPRRPATRGRVTSTADEEHAARSVRVSP